MSSGTVGRSISEDRDYIPKFDESQCACSEEADGEITQLFEVVFWLGLGS